MFISMEQTGYNYNAFAKRNMHPIRGVVLDRQDHSIIQCCYLLQLPVIRSHYNPCSLNTK